MNAKIKNQVVRIFCKVLADCRDEDEVESVLGSIVNEAEMLAVAKRLAIAVFFG